MIVLTCHHCSFSARVMGSGNRVSFLVGGDSQFAQDGYKCPRCRKQALTFPIQEAPPELLADQKMLHLEAEELFAALQGLGLPTERLAKKVEVDSILLSQRVTKVGSHDVRNSSRCVIEWIEVEDGTRLFLAGGGSGATVYRIRKPFSYTENLDGTGGTRIQERSPEESSG